MPVQDFLNAKSMVTPGIAGGLTMVITNALHTQFDLPQEWVALVLSFMIGTLALSDTSLVVWKRLLFYLLNCLIIFSMAVGSNTLGVRNAESGAGFFGSEAVDERGYETTFFEPWFDG